jgi:hypothetical protein
MLCIVLIIGAIITAFIRSPLRRQEAQHNVDNLIGNTNSLGTAANTNSIVNG